MSQSLPPHLVKATRGDYLISIKSIVTEAWQRIKGMKKAFWGGLALLFLIILGISIVLGLLLALCDIIYLPSIRSVLQFLAVGIMEVLRLLFSLSLVSLALNHLRNYPVNVKMAFSFKKAWKPLVLISVIFYLLYRLLILLVRSSYLGLYAVLGKALGSVVGLGLWCIFLIASVYITINFIMAMLLVLDQKMDIKKSLWVAFTAINQQWIKNMSLVILVGLGFLIGGLITLGVGLIWLLPMMSLVTALQYNQIFCEGHLNYKRDKSIDNH